MGKNENKVVRQCLIFLNMSPQCKVWRNNQIHVRGRIFNGLLGVGDIIGCYRGKFISIECKTQTGKTSEEQKEFVFEITAVGGIALIVTSLEDLTNQLYEIYK